MKKKLVCFLLAFVMLFLLVPVRAQASVSCELTGKGITFTWTYYVTYRYHGKECKSCETSPEANYTAWSHMNQEDKLTVMRHFSAFSSQLKGQFAHGDEMLEWALEKTGWRQLRDAFNKKVAQKYFPELDEFYSTVVQFSLDSSVSDNLTPEEIKNYEKLLGEYEIIRQRGKESYDRLLKLKNTQITSAVNAISSELIQIIMDNVTAGKPGGEIDDLVDAAVDFLDENLKITESVKKYTGLKTPDDYAKEFVDKFTGEDDRIDTGEAIELIGLIDRLMTAQEKHASVCMQKCRERALQLQALGASYTETAQTRREERKQAEADRDESYRRAVLLNINLTDLAPGISVSWSAYDSDNDGALDAQEDQNYKAACLAAAREWAQKEWRWAEEGLSELWKNNYQNETIEQGSPRYYDEKRWTQFEREYDYDNSKYLPNEFYMDAFSEVKELMGEDAPVFTGRPESPGNMGEKLFRERTDYREILTAYEHGYDKALDKLETLRSDMEKAKAAFLSAWENERDKYAQYASPYRTRAYDLTHQSEGEAYGDWRFDGETARQKWESFEAKNTEHGEYFLNKATRFDSAMSQLDREIASVTRDREAFLLARETFYNSLPEYFKQYAQIQTNLMDGLSIANNCLSELESMEAAYPDWVKQFNVLYSVNPVVGGAIIPDDIRDMLLADSRYFTGKEDYDQLVRILEDEVAPMVGGWLRREEELLDQIKRAERLIKENSGRIQEWTGWSRAELENLNSLPDVSHGVVIEPLVELISHTDPYYRYYNVVNYFDEEGAKVMPTQGYTPQLAVLYDDMMGNGSPMRALKGRYITLLEERGDLMRAAKDGKLYEMNDYYSSKGYAANYFSKNYPSSATWSDSSNIFYWASHGSFRNWDLYFYLNDVINPAADPIRAVNNGAYYNPVKELNKGPALAAEAGEDAVLQTGGTLRFQVIAVGEDEDAEPTNPAVYWSSSDESVASVDVEGTITGLLPGLVTITATADDSPQADPITAEFTLRVVSGGYTDPAQLGEGIYMLSPKAERSGSGVTVTGLLGTNGGDGLVRGTVIAAVYSNGRFAGSASAPFSVHGRETSSLFLSVPTLSSGSGACTVKLFLLESPDGRPLSGYAPIVMDIE